MNIEIKSRSLNNYLTYKLDKLETIYTKEELLTINELVIDNDENLDITVLKYFQNLENLELRNIVVNDETLNIILSLKTLKDLKFQLCQISNPNKLKELNLRGLHLDCSEIDEYTFIYDMTNLNELTLTGVSNLEIDKLNNLINLKYLNISHTQCTNDVLNIENLEELYIDNSSIENIEFVLELPNLKVLSLSKEQYENKKELIDQIRNRNIKILDYSIMLLGEI
jgi:hypothetical protein